MWEIVVLFGILAFLSFSLMALAVFSPTEEKHCCGCSCRKAE